MTDPIPDTPRAPASDNPAQARGIAVIIVNYGTADLVIAGVDSVLARAHGGRAVTVHVVDNASPEGDAAILQQAHRDRGWGEQVILYSEAVNHGFGRGNNHVIETLFGAESPPEFIFLLNPDARLENEALDILAGQLEARPQAGMAGAGIALPNGQPVTAAFRFPNARAEFALALNFGPVSRRFDRHAVALPPDHPGGPVDWVAGAAVMMRLDMLRQIGSFDPAYFLYFEEVDLMYRARQAGWEILYAPDARVLHAEGAATDQKSGRSERRARPAYWYNSWRIYHRKTQGRGGALRTGLAWMVGAGLNHVIAPLRGQAPAAPLNFFPDFTRHVMRPLLRSEDSAPDTEGMQADSSVELLAPNPGTQNGNPPDIGFWALVAEDYRTNDRDLFSQGFWALFWHRFGNWRMGLPKLLRIPATLLYRVMYKICQWVCGIMLPYTTRVGRRVRLDHFGGMILVAQAIGDDVIIRQNTTFGIAGLAGMEDRPVIANSVEIGAGAVIVGRLIVGAGAIVGANAVVTRDVPPGAVVGGVPARLIRMQEDPKVSAQ